MGASEDPMANPVPENPNRWNAHTGLRDKFYNHFMYITFDWIIPYYFFYKFANYTFDYLSSMIMTKEKEERWDVWLGWFYPFIKHTIRVICVDIPIEIFYMMWDETF